MSVITVSRGTFSGGKLLAEKVAEQLHYRCIDRDVIVEKAAASGVSQDELRSALDKPPTFLERFRHRRYLYLALVQAALAEEVCDGRVVYHGHVAHLLLKGGGPVFRVRVIAPLEYRIAMAQERLKLGRKEVIAYIRKVDEDRQKWARYLYGVDWGDPSLYDLVVNLEYMTLEAACDTVITAVKNQRCFEFDSACQAAMRDLARASRIKANIALNPDTSELELEVECEGGVVRIKGKATDVDQVAEIRRIASEMPGVTKVNLDDLRFRTPD